MKIVRRFVALVVLSIASSAWAYQVTGPVLEVTDSKIVVQKGKEKWEIARTPDTKVTGDLKAVLDDRQIRGREIGQRETEKIVLRTDS